MNTKTLKKIKEKVARLPLSPGVYIMLDKNGAVIYVGKAKALKNRVSQYFNNLAAHTVKVRRMVENVADFRYIVTSTELEALLLENTQIKLYKPKYNILLKDNKTYPYIRVGVKSEYPKIVMTRKAEQDGAKYFGPYSGAVSKIVSTVNDAFMLPTCSRVFPRDIGKARPCLRRDMGNCLAPCAGACSKEEYAEAAAAAVEFLQNGSGAIVEKLERRMTAASQRLDYERAAYFRDRIYAIKKLETKQKVVAGKEVNCDVVALRRGEFKAVAEVFRIRGGRLCYTSSSVFSAEETEDAGRFFYSFITQFYGKSADVPPEVICGEEPYEKELLQEYLTSLRRKKCAITVPLRGDKKARLDFAERNAAETLRLLMTKEEKNKKSVEKLGELLGLQKPPRRIEAVDVSHTSGDEMVAAIVLFENGQKQKSGYRHYRIKTVNLPDDYAAMSEVIARRFVRYINGEKGFETAPDLLLLDGGAGHLSVISGLLADIGIDAPCFGMVKDDKHRTRALVGKEGEIGLKPGSAEAVLVGTIQEEVHRFAIEYHRKSKRDKLKKSKLLEIPGIGEKKAAALIRRFGSMKKVGEASLGEIAGVKGLSARDARAVCDYFDKYNKTV